MSRVAALGAADRRILEVLVEGAQTVQEVADAIRRAAWEAWSDRHGYDFEWETDEEPLGARLLASGEARDAGLVLLAHEVYPRLRSLERRGLAERIQVAGRRPMLWRIPCRPS